MVCQAPRSHGALGRALTGAVRISAARCVLNGKTRSGPKPGGTRDHQDTRERPPRCGGRSLAALLPRTGRGLLLLVGVSLVLPVPLVVAVAGLGLHVDLLEVGELLLDVVLQPRPVVALEGA